MGGAFLDRLAGFFTHTIAANHGLIGDLSQLGQFVLVTVSAVGIFWQIKSQNDNSAREEYFRGLFSFNDRFQQLADMRGTLMDRFDQHDLTLSREAVLRYYTQYWLLNLEEWEYFCAGLLAVDTYIAWMNFAYAHIAGERNLSYFDRDDTVEVLSSRAIFEDLLFQSSYRSYTGFSAFFRGLYDLKPRDGHGDILLKADRDKRIGDYVRRYVRSQRIVQAHNARKYRQPAA